jgi:hypothetical protein
MALLRRTFMTATACPSLIVAWVASAAGHDEVADRQRKWCAGVPRVAIVVTGGLWIYVIAVGLLYPVTDSGNLANSWGGPTLAGAWLVHLSLLLALLLVVSLTLALALPPRVVRDGRSSPNAATERKN